MIVIATAHLQEARALIDALSLSEGPAVGGKRIFISERIRLLVTGMGMKYSSAATAAALSVEEPAIGAINFGVCAARPEIAPGTLCHVHCIHNGETGRRYYPDMLLNLSLPEYSLETRTTPYTGETAAHPAADLIDMEGAGFFEAASAVLAPSAIFTLKLVSDHGGTFENIRPLIPPLLSAAAADLIRAVAAITEWLESTQRLSVDEWRAIESLAKQLRLTETQRQKVIYLCRARRPLLEISPILDSFAHARPANREERTAYFDEITDALALPGI